MRSLTITRPDDWHVHLRDDRYLGTTVPDISRCFGRALVMPNLVPPVSTVGQAADYRSRILGHLDPASSFTPLMTLYITDSMQPAIVQEAQQTGFIHAFKLYPAGATTNSDAGIREIEKLFPVFEAMEKHEMRLAIHGEVTDPATDIFDREAIFIDRQLRPVMERFPSLKIILEHITTRDAVDFINASPETLAATITAHHLLFNRNDLLSGGMKPVYYCLPVLKRSSHQQALIEAATSGNPRFFLGTDSAPHTESAKEKACGCAAGCYTAHAAIELYAEVFESVGRLDRLEGFASHFGADFYGLPRNGEKIRLVQRSRDIPATLTFGETRLIPVRSGEQVRWTVEEMD